MTDEEAADMLESDMESTGGWGIPEMNRAQRKAIAALRHNSERKAEEAL